MVKCQRQTVFTLIGGTSFFAWRLMMNYNTAMARTDKYIHESNSVCMLIWDYWPGREGGAQRQCRKISHALSRRGFRIVVLTQRTCWWGRKTVIDREIPIVRLGLLAPLAAIAVRIQQWKTRWSKLPQGNGRESFRHGRRGGITTPFWWLARLSFMIAAQKYLEAKGGEIHLLHVHESNWIAGFASRVGAGIGLPVLCKAATLPCLTPMGPDVPFRRDLLNRRLLIRFIALNGAMAAELRAAGIAADRIHLIPNGVEIPSRPASPRDHGDVVFVANFTQGNHLKAYDILLNAWSLVHRQAPAAQLRMVGGGDSRPWRKLALALNCGASVTFEGFLENPDDLYRRAAIFVLPSRKEGMSNALLEAQSWGIPAVVSDIPGNTNVVTDCSNGLVVPVGDATALARAILRLLADPELRAALGVQARQSAVKNFSIGSVSALLADLYPRIIAAENRSAFSA